MPLKKESLEAIYVRCEQTGAWYGVNITTFDQRNSMGDTVLHTVCSWGELAAVEVLVRAGADINAKGDLGATPIFNAVMGESSDVVAFLLNSGADVSVANDYRRMVLDFAKNVSASPSIVNLLKKASK